MINNYINYNQLRKLKKILLISFLISLMCIGTLLHPSFNGTNKFINYLHSIVYDDNLEVNCSKGLEQEKVRLIFENNLALIENRNPEKARRIQKRSRIQKIIRLVIFEGGKQVTEIPYDYGKQRIVVYYDDQKIGEFGHWKTNGYHIHDYIVNLTIDNEIITLSGGIKGPDQRNNYLINEHNKK